MMQQEIHQDSITTPLCPGVTQIRKTKRYMLLGIAPSLSNSAPVLTAVALLNYSYEFGYLNIQLSIPASEGCHLC